MQDQVTPEQIDSYRRDGFVAIAANMTRHDRRAMTCAFMPDRATFNGQRNILPQDYFESLSEGDVLDNDEQNPLIWSQ